MQINKLHAKQNLDKSCDKYENLQFSSNNFWVKATKYKLLKYCFKWRHKGFSKFQYQNFFSKNFFDIHIAQLAATFLRSFMKKRRIFMGFNLISYKLIWAEGFLARFSNFQMGKCVLHLSNTLIHMWASCKK